MHRSRRGFLASAAASTGWFAGCGSLVGRDDDPVTVLAANSLQAALDEGVRGAAAAPLTVETRGSAAISRLVRNGQRDPDVLALADTVLFTDPLDARWYASFATNDLVVAYADTPGGRRVATADRWFEPLVDGDAQLGRMDPEVAPLGYRTRYALQLAADYYGRPGLADDVLAPDQLYPETSLVAALETGDIDAAILYRSMATQQGFDVVDLPAPINLGSPAYVDDYASVGYDLPDGPTVRGDVIEYGATLRHRRPATEMVFETLVAGDYLAEFGFDRHRDYPSYTDNAPEYV